MDLDEQATIELTESIDDHYSCFIVRPNARSDAVEAMRPSIVQVLLTQVVLHECIVTKYAYIASRHHNIWLLQRRPPCTDDSNWKSARQLSRE